MPLKLSPTPDLGDRRAMLMTALVVLAVVSAALILANWKVFHAALGDTDDATRFTLVADLLHGRGWWDQKVMRLQPPRGVWMHWSRLVDGGLAAMTWVFSLIPSPWKPIDMTRLVWPLMWILPTVLAALSLAKRFGGGSAVLACAIVLMTDLTLYNQFRPGRIDHHDLQIAAFLIALAGACWSDRGLRGAVAAGVATGLGLAVGLEALAFDVLIGASFGVRFLLDRERGRAAAAYGLSLAATSAAAFLVQTPPVRWGTPVCDALGVNLEVALVVAGLGLALAVRLTAARDWRVRLAGLAVAGAAAGAAYLGLDPDCRKGPFADVDPRIVPLWLDHVQEVAPVSRLFKRRPAEAIVTVTPMVLGTLAWLWLGRRRELRATVAWGLTGACLLAAVVAGVNAIRMGYFAEWIAAPLVAAAALDIVRRLYKGVLLATVALALALSPAVIAAAAGAIYEQTAPKKPPGKKHIPDYCANRFAWATLARARPVGLVLGEIDLGPFVLAHTPQSALAAPYHRMSWGMLADHEVLAASADDAGPLGAQAKARALNAIYVAECPAREANAFRIGMKPDALQKRLDAGQPPPWLEPLSQPKDPLQVYRLRPAGTEK